MRPYGKAFAWLRWIREKKEEKKSLGRAKVEKQKTQTGSKKNRFSRKKYRHRLGVFPQVDGGQTGGAGAAATTEEGH